MYHYKAYLKRIVDGDTLDLNVDLGFTVHVNIRVRLYGVDAPETYGVKHDSEEYQAGMAAKQFVEEWFRLSQVDEQLTCYIRTKKTGKYGRWLAMVWKAEDDIDKTELSLNAELIASGNAQAYTA